MPGLGLTLWLSMKGTVVCITWERKIHQNKMKKFISEISIKAVVRHTMLAKWSSSLTMILKITTNKDVNIGSGTILEPANSIVVTTESHHSAC